jgi:hypothetical protein
MTNGWPAPASQKLGAKWVEVTVWERMKMRFNYRRNELKTWPATTRRFRSGSADEQARVSRSALLSRIFGEAAGVGQPFVKIFDFQLPIANLTESAQVAIGREELEIGNRKLAMTYVV